jgi:hypothetical protein
MKSRSHQRILVLLLILVFVLSGCSGGKKPTVTATPTGIDQVSTQNVDVNPSGGKATAEATAEEEATEEPTQVPTEEATLEATSASTWTIVVDDTVSKETKGVAIQYSLVMIAENPLGTSDNASGTYTGTALIKESMDASQLDNSVISFSGGFDVAMTAESMSFDLISYDFETYRQMGEQLKYQVLAPLQENPWTYVAVAGIPMKGSGTVNPFAQGVQGESAGVNESASGSGTVVFDITVSPDGTVKVTSPTVPAAFTGTLIGGDASDQMDAARQKMTDMQQATPAQ